jgi:hypothetical protein
VLFCFRSFLDEESSEKQVIYSNSIHAVACKSFSFIIFLNHSYVLLYFIYHIQVKEMFGFKSDEPKNFIEHCCSWLLSFLILRGETADLNWLSKVNGYLF